MCIRDSLLRRGVAAARLDSSLSPEEVQTVQTGMLDVSLRILYVAPERLAN